jgi:hypothetical protein
MNRKYILYILVLIGTITTGQAQIFNPVYKETVWNYYRTGFANIQRPSGNKVHYYNILFESEPLENIPGYQSSVDVKIYVNKNQMHYVTSNVSVYQDQKDAFMLVKNPKVIFRTESGYNSENDELLQLLAVFSDSVLATSRVIDYHEGHNSKKDKIQLITIETSKEAVDAMNVERVVYQVNKTRDKIEKMTMFYVYGYKYKKTVLTHLETDLNYKRKMTVPVSSLFLSPNGQLYDKYKSYRYIDNR